MQNPGGREVPVQFDPVGEEFVVLPVGGGNPVPEQLTHSLRHGMLHPLPGRGDPYRLRQPPHLEQLGEPRGQRRGDRQQGAPGGEGQQIGSVGDQRVTGVHDCHDAVGHGPQLVGERDLLGV